MAGGRLPDYRLSALNKQTDERNVVGAAWKNESGSIAIRIDPFVKLEGSKSLALMLFPVEDDRPKRPKENPADYMPSPDDEMPF